MLFVLIHLDIQIFDETNAFQSILLMKMTELSQSLTMLHHLPSKTTSLPVYQPSSPVNYVMEIMAAFQKRWI